VTTSEHPAVPLGHQYAKTGPVFDCDFSSNKILYKFDTRGGESGSPLMVQANGRIQLIGVHTNWDVLDAKQVGQGTLLTDSVLGWVEQAINQLETVPALTFLRTV
jgi:V8-like Glu-specific endopeptidase